MLVTKSCNQNSCRDPWGYIHPDGSVRNLKDALDPAHDEFYASLPLVSFKECLNYQLPSNEEPFFPTFDITASSAFSQAFRNATDALGGPDYPGADDAVETIPEAGHFGAVYQDLAEIEKDARPLTDEEINGGQGGSRRRSLPYYG